MSLPKLTSLAERDLPGGHHRFLRAAVTRQDFHTPLKTCAHPDGHPLAPQP